MKPDRRFLAVPVMLVGVLCIALGLLLTLNSTPAAAQGPSPDDFVGVGECNDCHRSVANEFETNAHTMTFFAAEDFPEAIIGDFSGGEEARMFEFPDEHAPRPFTLDDIAYVVGAGRMAQRYLIDVGDGEYHVLPAEWNVAEGEWQTFPMPYGDDFGANCASCHTTGYDSSAQQWEDDGVTCEGCHGPGLTHVDAADDAGREVDDEELATILAAIDTDPDPATCGSCHSQWTEVETCDDPVHCSDMPYDSWLISPHAQLVENTAADTAGDQTYALACSGCHLMHDNEGSINSLREEVTENTCLACHEDTGAGGLLRGDTIVDNVPGLASAHHEEGLVCESCHNVHTVQSIPDDPEIATACTNCHTDLTQSTIRDFAADAQGKVATRLSQIEAVVDDSDPEWVHTVVTAIEHDGSGGIHNFAYVSRLLNAVETELGILETAPVEVIPLVTASDPAECAECHAEVHTVWQTSPHANASLSATFQQAYAENGQPSYCMTCHASGYDPATETYVFEGVVCSTCHMMESGEHPPGPMPISDSSQSCGRCHSGEHSPEYNEWLVSEHSNFNVDCVDCHVAHDNSLRLGDVNSTCAGCHENAMNDEVHMGEDMNCVDCHMTRSTDDEDVIHHTMFFDPKTCAECHGDIHDLQFDPTRGLSEGDQQLVSTMQGEIDSLETKADTNLQSGIVGGAVGSLVLIGFLFLVIRFGRMR